MAVARDKFEAYPKPFIGIRDGNTFDNRCSSHGSY